MIAPVLAALLLPLSAVNAADSALVARQNAVDPCAEFCDPWFSIADPEQACQFLNTNISTFAQCASCSLVNGGTIDDWARFYYEGDYNYFQDCPACYDLPVAGIDFGNVNGFLASNGNASTNATAAALSASLSNTASLAAASATGSAAHISLSNLPASASVGAQSASGSAAAKLGQDNTYSADSSAANGLPAASLFSLLAAFLLSQL